MARQIYNVKQRQMIRKINFYQAKIRVLQKSNDPNINTYEYYKMRIDIIKDKVKGLNHVL